MMKYKRLTERLADGTADVNCSKCKNYKKCGDEWCCDDDSDCNTKIIDRLAELEDKIERGELVENKVITHVNMARSNSKTLIQKALRYDELKAKIEQGTLIELPCRVGDKVYKIMHVCGKRRVVEFIVSRISILLKEVCIYFHKSKESWHEWCTKPHHFGENIFLTREEAEIKLKGLKEVE